MRLRNVPGSRDTIAESQFTIKNETECKGKWNEIFGNDNPILYLPVNIDGITYTSYE